ncbi:hypothetical protein GCM10010919_00890 [Alishewanella longhuensis]|uniref:Uncharacterized protein n=2 Tax=Alishewanella longhuensis TaxID=1091037 RepID=A0ABQ3KTA0_9ALTE|nr:hypothetical protein GCM10010919_00890 [Alishewanella longhuensis]
MALYRYCLIGFSSKNKIFLNGFFSDFYGEIFSGEPLLDGELALFSPDLILCDLDGFNYKDFIDLSTLKFFSEIIFFSENSRYALPAYHLDALDFIGKPISINRLNISLSKARRRLIFKAGLVSEGRSAAYIKYVFVCVNGVLKVVSIKDVVSILEVAGSRYFKIKGYESLFLNKSCLGFSEKILDPVIFYKRSDGVFCRRSTDAFINEDEPHRFL